MALIKFKGGPLDTKEAEISSGILRDGSYYAVFGVSMLTNDRTLSKRIKGPYASRGWGFIGEDWYQYRKGIMHHENK